MSRSLKHSAVRRRALAVSASCLTVGTLVFPSLAGAMSPTWGSPHVVAGTLGLGHDGSVATISCTRVGDCTAGGSFPTTSGSEAFVATETNGHWAAAIEIGAAFDSGHAGAVSTISCTSPGNCGAGGSFKNGAGTQAFTANEIGGHWGAVTEVAGTLNTANNATIYSISCTAVGACSAAGGLESAAKGGQAFVITETGGSWGAAREVASSLNTGDAGYAGAISCSSPGYCSAGGDYKVGPQPEANYEAFVVSQFHGHWGNAKEVATRLNTGGRGYTSALSCTANGYCSAVGTYFGSSTGWSSFTVSETHGNWGATIRIRGSVPDFSSVGGGAGGSSISCMSPGYCEAAGTARYSDGWAAYAVSDTAGSWGTVHLLAQSLNKNGNAGATSVSCASVGNCALVGFYQHNVGATGYADDFVAMESGGHWGATAWLPGTHTAAGNSSAIQVSCTKSFYCGTGGAFTRSGTSRAFVSNT